MKENAIKKINKIGKVGGILTTIAKVLCILVLVIALVATVAFALVPKDFMELRLNGSGTIKMNMAAIGQSISEEEKAELLSGETVENINLEIEGNEFTFEEIAVDGDNVTIGASMNEVEVLNLHDLFYVFGVVDLRMLFTIISLFFGGFVCKALKNCESPFEEEVILKMRNFAYSLIPWVILTSITDSMITSLSSGRFDMSLSLNIPILIIVVVIFVLISIFRYGAVLQQESDETL